MNVINLLVLVLCSFKVCETATFPDSKSLHAKLIDATEEKETQFAETESQQPPADSPKSSKSFFYGLSKAFDVLVNGPPPAETDFVNLPSGIVPENEILSVIPVLIDNFNLLELISQTIEANEIIIAAVKLRSLVPHEVFNVANIVKSRYQRPRKPEPESFVLHARNSHVRILDFLESLFFSLPEVHFVSSMHQIVGFDFNGNRSLDEFVAEKEAEIANEFVEVIPFIGQIKEALRLSSSISPEKLTAEKLYAIVYNLHCIKSRYGSIISFKTPECSEKDFAKNTSVLRKIMRELVLNLAEILATL